MFEILCHLRKWKNTSSNMISYTSQVKRKTQPMSSLSTSRGVSFSLAAGGATTSLGSGHQMMDIQEHQDTFPDTPADGVWPCLFST